MPAVVHKIIILDQCSSAGRWSAALALNASNPKAGLPHIVLEASIFGITNGLNLGFDEKHIVDTLVI